MIIVSIYTFHLKFVFMTGKISDLTWHEFREQCGYDAFIKNPRKSYRNFEMHHYGKYVNWDGYVIRVNLNDDDPLSIAYHTT